MLFVQKIKQPSIKIRSSIGQVNEKWIWQELDEFIQASFPFMKKFNLELNLSYQPIEKKIVKCIACLQAENSFTFAQGEGINEYEAVKNLIENLDIELRITSLQTINQETRKKQFA